MVPLTKEDKLMNEKNKERMVKGLKQPLNHKRRSTVNLNVRLLPDGSEAKQILNHISGYAKPKEVLAIMGGSGCGKTSLLNVLAHRMSLSPGSTLSGEV